VEKAVKERKINHTHQEKERTKIKKQALESRFLKYTSEGYVETQKNQDSGVISWQ